MSLLLVGLKTLMTGYLCLRRTNEFEATHLSCYTIINYKSFFLDSFGENYLTRLGKTAGIPISGAARLQ